MRVLNIKSTILLSTGFIFLVLTGCKKFLYQEPHNNLSISDIFNDVEGARTTLAGCYDNLKSYDYYVRTFSIYPEVTSGNIKYSKAANQALFLTYNFSNDSITNDMSGFYEQAYSTIYNANSIIENVTKIGDASVEQRNRFLAEAYSIRALVNFDLVRVFAQSYSYTPGASHAGIIIKNKNTSILDPLPPVSSCKQVFAQVVSDLDSAILLFPQSMKIFSLGDDRTYFSLDAAKALLCRVSLYMNNWQEVISLASDLINSNKYPLIPNSQYVSSWSKKNISSESIFELAYGSGSGGSLGDYYNPLNSSYGQLATTNDLLSLFDPGDVRGSNSMFVAATINSSLYYFSKKYQGMNDSANNIKILRISEIYLNRAEAYAQLNDLSNALLDLNTIRKRANPTAVDYLSGDQQQLLNEIYNERRRELCFEGQTFFDMSRQRRDLIRIDCTSPNASFTYPDKRFACPKPLIF
ncbi:MAG: RagB/SusD family nutrient uptake outer membrane protein [Ferruginibacter sp.]